MLFAGACPPKQSALLSIGHIVSPPVRPCLRRPCHSPHLGDFWGTGRCRALHLGPRPISRWVPRHMGPGTCMWVQQVGAASGTPLRSLLISPQTAMAMPAAASMSIFANAGVLRVVLGVGCLLCAGTGA